MMVKVSPSATKSLQAQVVQEIEERIARGYLSYGDKLPACEELAKEVGIHRLTVLAAYRELARRGRVSSHPGKGTVVCQFPREVREEIFRGLLQTVIDRGRKLGLSGEEIKEGLQVVGVESLAGERGYSSAERRNDADWDLFAPSFRH